jgi:peroxiredoxin
MNVTRRLFSILGLAAALGVTAALAPADETATVGRRAPTWTSDDVLVQKPIKLEDYLGNIVILEWINPDCPVCRRVYETGVINKTLQTVRQASPNVKYIAINSTATKNNQPVTKEAVTSQSISFLKTHKINIPLVIDHDGRIGRMYNAQTTPHMFVIDSTGVLRYTGALDDDPAGKKATAGETVTNYVVNAVNKLVANETVTPDTTRAYGCSIKYAAQAAVAD